MKSEGCRLIHFHAISDERGRFMKPFDAKMLAKEGIKFDVEQSFFSFSKKNTIRGMHFQTPPFDQDKLIVCLKGRALDVVVDLRKDSPSYGSAASFNLTSETASAVWIPKGFAHGFLSLEDDTLLGYFVNSEHSSQHDTGIRWDSFAFNWQVTNPIISGRDKALPSLKDFESPF